MIERLKTIQEILGEKDGPFAKRLGIKRPLWIAIKTGRSKPGRKSLPAILTAFPTLVKHLDDVN